MALIGTTIGRYRITAALGSGGMGTVWRATGPTGVVALKVVHPHLLAQPDFLSRFLREAELGRRVVHENVVRTIDVEVQDVDGKPVHALVMEYVEGQTLRALLTDLDRVPEELCRHIGREVAKGLAAVHAAGIVHRDLKPENVLITKANAVKVMDLGVARLADEARRLSQTGMFVGSLEYAAPEQLGEGGQDADARADLYSLGLVLYEMSSGQHPFAADSIVGTIRRRVQETPRRLGDVNPQLSPLFEEVVHALLEKDRDARLASATELVRVLEEGEEGDWWRTRARALRAATQRPLRRIRIPRETAVYGRETELAQLRTLYERAREGHGQIVLIEGEAGIGKSRLVDELVGRLQAGGEAVNFLYGEYPPGGAATAAGAFAAAYRGQFGEETLEESLRGYLKPTPLLVPAFAAFLRGETSPTGAVPLTKDSLQTCFAHATRALAAERTTVVLIDDLHFAPEEGRALFSSLASAVSGHRILLIGTMRPGVSEAWISGVTRLDATTRMSLGRLGPKELIRLLEDAFHSRELASSLGAQVALKSDGNPFFAFEIVRGLREGQFITRRADGTWVTSRVIGEIRIPSSVQDLVDARIADLTGDERGLLEVASCWGFEFDPLLVGDVLGLAQIPLMRSLAHIERRHRLVRSVGRRYVFDHHQIQEALYRAMPELLREAYHAALASAHEARRHASEEEPAALDGGLCVELCDHFLRGGKGERAVRYLARAQSHLFSTYANAEAVGLTERALAVHALLTGTARAHALLGLCTVLRRVGLRERHEEAAREAERLAEAAGDDGLRGQALRELGTVLQLTSRYPEAEACFRRAQELARARGDRASEALLDFDLGRILQHTGRLVEARGLYEQCLGISRGLGHREGEANSLLMLGSLLRAERRYAEAQEPYERALQIYQEIGKRQGVALAMVGLSRVLTTKGRLAEAREHQESALAVHQELGDRMGEAGALTNLGLTFLNEGRFAEAQDSLERALAIFREIGSRHGAGTVLVNLGVLALTAGRFREAGESFERAIALSRESGLRKTEGSAIGGLGEVLHAQGRIKEAREHHERHRAICQELGDRGGEAAALQNLGHALAAEGDLAAARDRYLAAAALSDAIGSRTQSASARAALGSLEVRAGSESRAREALESAREEASKGGATSVEVLARCRLASLTGDGVAEAEKAFLANPLRLTATERREARWLLWKATGDRAHLAEAKRSLDEQRAADPEHHEEILSNLRLNREIVAAIGEIEVE